MDPQVAAQRWQNQESLSRQEAADLMQQLASGEVDEAIITALLENSLSKPLDPQELAGMASVMREFTARIPHSLPDVIDTCGTGGGPATINLSTGAAIVAAAAGAKVAKHGNRSITSTCGSADVLEAWGVPIGLTPERQAASLHEIGIAFLFAPLMHTSMAAVGPVRRRLGMRTIFNVLGPLTNPARASRQLIGVYDKAFVRPVAEALCILGTTHAFVVHSEDGCDEVSAIYPTYYAEVKSGAITEGAWEPTDFGIAVGIEDHWLKGEESVQQNAYKLEHTLSDSGRGELLVPNGAVAILLAGLETDLRAAADRARTAISSRATINKLNEMRKFS